MSQKEAFAELRRCSGTQFDPKMVEHFIEVIKARNENRPNSTLRVSKEAALQIGLQLERLTSAFDRQDLTTLKMLAGKLKHTATVEGLQEISELAGRLESSIDGKHDMIQLVGLTQALLETCRATQMAYIKNSRDLPSTSSSTYQEV